MFKGQITFDTLILRYPPSVAEFLMEEIAKADLISTAANEDPVNDMMRDDWVEASKAHGLWAV